jgi:GntR family transcriptional regulator
LFILNPQSGTPIYRQLMEQVRRLVASGQLAPGTALPSVRELAMEHAVNPMTISKAYNLLEMEGLLVRNRGKPMTVAARPRGLTPRARRLRQIDHEVGQLVLAARQLELDRKDVIALINEKWEDEDGGSSRQRARA